ncbi:MAG TPA: glycosyltransferase family 39 protein, partial [Thermoanaerobaculia bacterium]
MRNAHERRLLFGFLAALVLLTAARIAYVSPIAGERYFTKYTHFADRAIARDVDRERLPDLSPGYLWFVALLRLLGADHWTLRGVQIAMTGVVAGCVALIAYRVSGTVAAIAAAAIVLTNKAALVNASDFEPETLILMLEAIALALLIGTRTSPRAEIAGGLCLGLATICRPVALLMAVAIGVWLWRASRRVPLAFGIAVALPVMAIVAINARLTGSALIMDPGTVLYEGMNARATGCTGSRPGIIRDLEPTISTPDPLHVAYRIVAARALGLERIPRERANDYWMQKTIAYVRAAPGAAVRLTWQKALAALHAGDTYDLYGMARVSRLMTIPIW